MTGSVGVVLVDTVETVVDTMVGDITPAPEITEFVFNWPDAILSTVDFGKYSVTIITFVFVKISFDDWIKSGELNSKNMI